MKVQINEFIRPTGIVCVCHIFFLCAKELYCCPKSTKEPTSMSLTVLLVDLVLITMNTHCFFFNSIPHTPSKYLPEPHVDPSTV